jgi:hypothetical protein
VSARARAAKAFEDFKGERPTKVLKAKLPDKDVTGWEMGPMVGVAYEARRDGKTSQYFHEFKKSARPRLVAQDDGRKLYIEGGRFKVTDRGIEDMPNLFVLNPSSRSGGTAPKRKGSTMARRARRRRSHVSVFTSNPRRRRRPRARAPARRRHVFATNPVRRRRRASSRRIFARNPARRRRYRRNPVARRSFRRNPSGGVGRLTSMVMPAVMIGLGALGTEIVTGYLPIPMAWKTGPMRYVTKAGVGIAIGLVLAKAFKMKKVGYYFAAGAIAIGIHDFAKSWLAANTSVKGLSGLGYYNPGSVARFAGMSQYTRGRPGLGMYGPALRNQLGGDNSISNARMPGGEMNFAA